MSIEIFGGTATVQGIYDSWIAANPYDAGDEFTQPRSSDGALWLFQVPVSFTGLSGAAFDATEEARFTAVGVAPAAPTGVAPTVLQGILDSDAFTNVPYGYSGKVFNYEGFVKGSSSIISARSQRFGASWSFDLNYQHDNQQFEFANVGTDLYGLPYAIVVKETTEDWPGGVAPPPTITSFTPASGPVGTEVTVIGTNFASITGIFLGGTQVTVYTVDAASQIRFTVPVGASTTPFQISTPTGSAVSATNFDVTVPSAATVRQTTVNLPNPVARSVFDNFYAGQAGINAPDTVPPEVTAVAIGSSVSIYDVYLGHNQWWWTNTGGAAWSSSWTVGDFAGFVQTIYTFK